MPNTAPERFALPSRDTRVLSKAEYNDALAWACPADEIGIFHDEFDPEQSLTPSVPDSYDIERSVEYRRFCTEVGVLQVPLCNASFDSLLTDLASPPDARFENQRVRCVEAIVGHIFQLAGTAPDIHETQAYLRKRFYRDILKLAQSKSKQIPVVLKFIRSTMHEITSCNATSPASAAARSEGMARFE